MWNVAVLVILIAVAGVYTTRNVQTLDAVQGSLDASNAAEMGIYRQAVIDYFSAHDLRATSVAAATLRSSGYLPAWTRMYQQGGALAWSNYRDANGVIYVYALGVPDRSLAGELVRLARHSVLLGGYDGNSATLQSPVHGNTGIPISALSGRSIPDGAPVWIAMTK